MRRKHSLTGSFAAKVAAFILLAVSAAVAFVSAVSCNYLAEMGLYGSGADLEDAILDAVRGYTASYSNEVVYCLENGNVKGAEEFMAGTNAQALLLEASDRYSGEESAVIWQSGGIGEEWLQRDVTVQFHFPEESRKPYTLEGTRLWEDRNYILRVCFDPEFPVRDGVRDEYLLVTTLYRFRFLVIWLIFGSALLCIACFLFLLRAAGHKNGEEGIVPSLFTNMHFDVFTFAVFGCMCCLFLVGANIYYVGSVLELLAMAALLLAAGVLLMLYLMEFAIRLKLGKWWQHTLIYVVLRWIGRGVGVSARGLWRLLCKLPTVITTVGVFLGLAILELFLILLWEPDVEGLLTGWMLEKAGLLLVILYLALSCKKLLYASKALAEGQETYRVDTSYMFGDFKRHGENLNSLGQGITKAVEERLKSEHMKTELITNISHDLKTPLTSIINYADLICEEKPENPKIREYSGVLLRQAKRLKKLLEDLIEASKAATGNLEVNIEPCEVGVLLSQAVGEYQHRMEEKGLELITRQPKEPVKIMADGRHLWRIFDNLLNNICKYAQENSRVYLNVVQCADRVQIVFRNMSKYALDITAQELEERFVRGDKSRHMEGNGLGLSIAKSLAGLQGGRLEIVIDGDLFKVTVEFKVSSPITWKEKIPS